MNFRYIIIEHVSFNSLCTLKISSSSIEVSSSPRRFSHHVEDGGGDREPLAALLGRRTVLREERGAAGDGEGRTKAGGRG